MASLENLVAQIMRQQSSSQLFSRFVASTGNPDLLGVLNIAKTNALMIANERDSSAHSSNDVQHLNSESDGEVEFVGDSRIEIPDLPPVAALFRPPLEVGKVYIVKQRPSSCGRWGLAKLITIFYNVHKGVTKNRCLVQYDSGHLAPTHLELYEMAYLETWATQIPLGTAIVSNSPLNSTLYYSGIILEVPNLLNNSRYLVFFDNGTIAYRDHKNIKVLCDVYQANTSAMNRFFVQDTLNLHPERLLLKFKVGEKVLVKKKGDWQQGVVREIDCSIFRLEFTTGLSQWFHRGSYKLKNVIDGHLPKSLKNYAHLYLAKILRNRKMPITDSTPPDPKQRSAEVNATKHHLSVLSQRERSLTVVTPRLLFFPQDLSFHACNENCVPGENTMSRIDPRSGPLLRPLLIGFKRFTERYLIKYKTPCGRIVSNFEDMYNYIVQTKLDLSLENFDFSAKVNVKRLYSPSPGSALVTINDISNNLEEGGLPCVNEVDNSTPEPITYMTTRKMLNGRDDLLNNGGDFVSCCSCEDNCKNAEKCECIQLTRSSYKELNETNPLSDGEMSYQHKRLYKEVRSGIYECNSKCKCNAQCPNRVVQFSMRAKLQVFNAGKKGWGVRTLYDIPKGAFVCTYTGMVLNEEEANTWGGLHGDEYLTDLDFVEKQESLKPGYEDSVPDMNEPQTKESSTDAHTNGSKTTKKRKKSSKQVTLERRSSKRVAKTKEVVTQYLTKAKRRKTDKGNRGGYSFPIGSLRRLYPPDYAEFTLDAKTCGNVGRYINHSCEPNMFVQNVFIDTHDLRLPWVAFFTLVDIPAGTELTWNYNYLFGSVRGKRLYCLCLSPLCVVRLY